jgi:hypothetical protein
LVVGDHPSSFVSTPDAAPPRDSGLLLDEGVRQQVAILPQLPAVEVASLPVGLVLSGVGISFDGLFDAELARIAPSRRSDPFVFG